MRRVAGLSVLLLILALAACEDDGGPGGSANGDTVGGSDTAQGSDGTQGGDGGPDGDGEPAGPACETDEDCEEAGAVCDCNGACVVPDGEACTENQNCPAQAWCNPCVGHCMDHLGLCEPCQPVNVCDGDGSCQVAKGGPCGTDAQPAACIPFASGDRACGQACIGDVGCPTGYECVEVEGAADKQCVPTTGQCTDLGLCEDDDECPVGQICNDFSSKCAAGCEDDVGCTDALPVCSQGRCQESCVDAQNCENHEQCDEETGRCFDPSVCQPGECKPQSYCDEESGDCIPGCLEDSHCQDAQFACEDNECVEKGCIHNYQCSFEENCDKDTGECVPMERDHCAECTGGQQDSNDQCGGDPNLCVTFQDEDGNEKGDHCLLTCHDDEEIDKCPQGYGCEKIESDDGSINDYYCTRPCWENPFGNTEPEEGEEGEEEEGR